MILVDPRDGRTAAAADRPDVRSVTGDAIAARRTSPSVRLLHLHVCARRMAERCPDQSSRRSTPWRELTSYFLLRPRGASLLAQTGRSEQGDVRSQSRWPRLDPPPPPSIGLMASAGRPAAWPRQAEGRTIEVESSSLAPRASPRDRVTTPAGREEPGTSLYPSYNDTPMHPVRGHAKEATSGVSCTPASPAPGGATRTHRSVRTQRSPRRSSHRHDL